MVVRSFSIAKDKDAYERTESPFRAVTENM